MPIPGEKRIIKARLLAWLRVHGYHLLFGMTLVSLASLIAWWSVFIRAAIVRMQEETLASLRTNIRNFSLLIGHDNQSRPMLGPLTDDPRLEIILCVPWEGDMSRQLAPFWPDYCLHPQPDFLAALNRKFHSRTIMVFGESSMLVLLILVSSFMLYRLIWIERRTAKELQEFWSRVTHEIKTPITGIKAFLQTLLKHDLSRDELVPLVSIALQQVERQQQLAENILIGRRLTQSTPLMNIIPLNLPEYLARYMEAHSLQLSDVQAFLSLQCTNPFMVMADPDALRVILDNILDNAVKYGGEALVLTIEASAAGRHGLIRFTDNGPGFTAEHAESLFEAYRRLTDELPDGQHGTGMGLNISRQLARRMRGDITASSQGRGKGACFTLYLPRDDGEAA